MMIGHRVLSHCKESNQMKKFEKGSWIHQLYIFGCSGIRNKDRKNSEITVGTFSRRVTLSVVFVAYVSMLKLLGFWIFAILFEVPALILTVLANAVTIPLGFGIAELYPGKKFLNHPFQVQVGGKPMNLAWFLIPTWIFLANVWFVLYGHMENLVSVSVWIYSLIALIAYVQVVNFARKGDFTVEFVDHLEESNESTV